MRAAGFVVIIPVVLFVLAVMVRASRHQSEVELRELVDRREAEAHRR